MVCFYKAEKVNVCDIRDKLDNVAIFTGCLWSFWPFLCV